MNKYILLAIMLASISSYAIIPVIDDLQENIPELNTEKFDVALQGKLDPILKGYAYVLTNNGEVITKGGGGVARHDGNQIVPYMPNTKAYIGSVSKMITTIAIMHALENGASFTLDDKIESFLPQQWKATLPGSSKNITIRQLLMHKSGFRDIPDEIVDAALLEEYGEDSEYLEDEVSIEALKYYLEVGVEANHVGQREYHNINFKLLGLIFKKMALPSITNILDNATWQSVNGNIHEYDKVLYDNHINYLAYYVKEHLLDVINVEQSYDISDYLEEGNYAASFIDKDDFEGYDFKGDLYGSAHGSYVMSALDLAKFMAYIRHSELIISNNVFDMLFDPDQQDDRLGWNEAQQEDDFWWYGHNGARFHYIDADKLTKKQCYALAINYGKYQLVILNNSTKKPILEVLEAFKIALNESCDIASMNDYIDEITFNDQTITTGKDFGYKDNSHDDKENFHIYNQKYTNYFTLIPGHSYSNKPVSWGVWMDLNNDGGYTAFERIFHTESIVGPVSDQFKMPTLVMEYGLYNMVIGMKVGDEELKTPHQGCINEIEKYGILVDQPYCKVSPDKSEHTITSIKVDDKSIEPSQSSGYVNALNSTFEVTKNIESILEVNSTIVPGLDYKQYEPSNLYWKVWIDTNRDGKFSVSELKYFSVEPESKIIEPINLHAGINPGKTAMRIAMRVGEPVPNECMEYENGHVVDVSLIIKESPYANCSAPKSLIVKDIGPNGAHLSWQPYDQLNNKVYYRDVDGGEWNEKSVYATELTLTGLKPLTKYEWKVYNPCEGPNNYPAQFSNSSYFTTLAYGNCKTDPNEYQNGGPNNTLDQAAYMPININVYGSICEIEDLDWYMFVAEGQNNDLVIELTGESGGDLDADYNMFLVTENEILAASAQPGNVQEKINISVGAGKYYILIYSTEDKVVPNFYKLRVKSTFDEMAFIGEEDNFISAFPNPTSEGVTLNIGSSNTSHTYKIIDSYGVLQGSGTLKTNSGGSYYLSDTERLLPGIYNLTIQFADKQRSVRLVVE